MKQNKLFKQLGKKVKSIVEDRKHSAIFNKYPDDIFNDVKYYVMFIGYAHSGHSLIGALLDAHPNMIISNELHALPLFANYNYDKYKIFKLILDNSIRLRTGRIRVTITIFQICIRVNLRSWR
jgi:hypothetical protein